MAGSFGAGLVQGAILCGAALAALSLAAPQPERDAAMGGAAVVRPAEPRGGKAAEASPADRGEPATGPDEVATPAVAMPSRPQAREDAPGTPSLVPLSVAVLEPGPAPGTGSDTSPTAPAGLEASAARPGPGLPILLPPRREAPPFALAPVATDPLGTGTGTITPPGNAPAVPGRAGVAEPSVRSAAGRPMVTSAADLATDASPADEPAAETAERPRALPPAPGGLPEAQPIPPGGHPAPDLTLSADLPPALAPAQARP